MRPLPALFLPALLTVAACSSTGRYLSTRPQAAPDRQIPSILAYDQYGKTVNLREATSSSPWTLVFFYPEANTPG